MNIDAFARRASRHGNTAPLTGADPENPAGYDGPPAGPRQNYWTASTQIQALAMDALRDRQCQQRQAVAA